MSETLGRMLQHTLKTYPKHEFMLVKREGKYVPISSAEFGGMVRRLALGLHSLGFGKGDKLCLLSENRPEWTMFDLAVLSLGGLTVPIYTTLVGEQIRYIIEDSDAKVVVVSSRELWKKVEPLRPRLPKVGSYILMTADVPDGAMTMDDLADRGRKLEAQQPGLFEQLLDAVRPDDEASIIYTSGTTGDPKGVVLTHDNFLSNVKTAADIMEFSCEDRVLSFLPLSHVLERMVMFAYLYVGATIAFAESVEAVAQNLVEVRPTIMVSVPRVFEKIYARVMDQVLASPPLRRRIFFWAVATGKKHSAAVLAGRKVGPGLKLRLAVARKLVFSKILAKTGGRVRFFVSGGAPLAKDIGEFFHAIGLIVYEGYGLTETSPVLAVNTPGHIKFGTVGRPIPGVEIRIAPDGEILARGPNIMKGYYKKEAETREAFEGGWFHTGDIGHLDEDGFLVITDRKKDLIVTSGGKNVAPQPIENLLKTIPYISNVVVIGDRRKFVSALVVPNFEKLEEWARSAGIAFGSREELVRDKRVEAFLQAEIDKATPNLASYERVKKLRALSRDFELEQGEITPTLKVRRGSIEARYRELIDGMYREEPLDNKDAGGD
jgi:long-chain acyl-CoA synthetase